VLQYKYINLSLIVTLLHLTLKMNAYSNNPGCFLSQVRICQWTEFTQYLSFSMSKMQPSLLASKHVLCFRRNDGLDKYCYDSRIPVVSYLCLPHEMRRHVVFSSVVCWSVRSSVCPSHFRVRSISFEPLVGFTNNFAQMSSMIRQCAVPMFDQGRVKVKITI